jgi:RNA polymerase sigma-70 factor (ECF subfamily)
VSTPNTRWTVIDAARGGDAAACERLVERYRAPIVHYFRRRGLENDAEDLAQEVFLRVFEKEVLAGADPAKGRFRSLLLAVARNVANGHLRHQQALKRGGAAQIEPLVGEVPSREDDAAFDREWLANLLDLGLRRLRDEYPRYYAALSRFLLQEQSYAQIGAALGCSKGEVNNLIYRGKRKLAGYLRDEVADYSSGPGALETELAFMGRLLGEPGQGA